VNTPGDLLDAAPCGFLAFADDGTLRRINRTLLEMLGYERDELIGRHIERIFTVGSRIFYQTHWFPLLRLHGRAEEIFLMLRGRSGEDIGVLVNALRRDDGGELSYHCVLMRVRERQKYEDELLRARRTAENARAELEAQKRELEAANRRLEEQAAELEIAGEELRVVNEELLERTEEAERMRAVADEANQAKSTFLAVMSHELRTPLNAIAGYVELLELGIPGSITDAQRQMLSRIARSQRHLLRLINDVLNLARIEAGHVDYAIEDVPVDVLVADVVPMVEPQLEQKLIDFSVALEPGLVARVDREKCQQVLLNLLGNAAKFTPAGGGVKLEADGGGDRENCIRIRVFDTGIGIPPDKLDAVFLPFVQVDATRTRTAEGSGLGLAISRDLARGMSGDLKVESVPGEGSTFTLVLPRAGAQDRGTEPGHG
jgi:PAS domain S-box-containing protein